MKKHILTILTISSLVVLAGCSSAPALVNKNVRNTETLNQNENTEVVVNANDNANAEENTNEDVNENANMNADVEADEIDTSDWLTYTNEEYGFSFKYPSDWVVIQANANSSGKIYVYSKQNDGDNDGELASGETKIDISTITSQDDFLTEGALCQRQYSTLKKVDYEIRCSTLQSNGLSFLEIETEIFPDGELPGDSISLLYTHSQDKPFQIKMNAYFGSSDALYSSEKTVVESIFSSVQIFP